MTVDHLYFAWWVDPEHGETWVRHDCTHGSDEYRLPIGEDHWQIDVIVGTPKPSFDCARCGRHSVLDETDRIDPPRVGEADV